MTRYIDIGHHAIKYCDDSAAVQRVQTSAQNLDALLDVESVVLASVVEDPRINEVLKQRQIQPLVVQRDAYGVVLDYTDPKAFGVDRWLTLIAAASDKKNILVIDAGSALTLDLIAKDGQRCGGCIIPGEAAYFSALAAISPKLNVAKAKRDTCAQLTQGWQWAVQGAVQQLIEQSYFDNCEIFICGGDGPKLLSFFEKFICHSRPDLVIDGLKCIRRLS